LIPRDTFVICEGREDEAFFQALVRARPSIFPEACVETIGVGSRRARTPEVGEPKVGAGIDGLAAHLIGLMGRPDFRSKRFIILADADDGIDSAMQRITNKIKEANKAVDIKGFYPVPASAFETKNKEGIYLTVVLFPGNGDPGCLETLLLRYLRRKWSKEAACVDSLITCSEIGNGSPPSWSLSKQEKARVRSFIAIVNKEYPAVPLQNLWDRGDLIPLNDTEFDGIKDKLLSAF
jgi:hypothetical protein